MSNKWNVRLFVGLAIWLAASAHQKICADVANTPEGMFLYHGAAALFDFATLVVSAYTLKGRLSDDLQALCFASMVINCIGWILYLAWIMPSVYNSAVLGVGSVQYIRLLLGDLYDDHSLRSDLVFRRDHGRSEFHTKKADQ